jgi:hypothetical protein
MPLFTQVRGRGILGSPYPAFCMDRLVGPTEDPLPRSYAWNSTLHVLALHGYPPWCMGRGGVRGGQSLSSGHRLADSADLLALATSGLQRNHDTQSTDFRPQMTLV